MKKITALMLSMVMIILSVTSASAMEIRQMDGNMQFRNGITYGMTMEDVIAFENSKGNTEYETSENDDAEVYSRSISYSSEVGGEPATLMYHFDQKDTLIGMDYNFASDNNKDQNKYNKMYTSIVQKYGEPMEKGDIISSSLYSITLYENLRTWASYQYLGINSYKLTDIAQWIVSFEDCYLLIDIHYKSSYGYQLCIGYRLFSETELENLLKNDQETIEEENQQRLNDL